MDEVQHPREAMLCQGNFLRIMAFIFSIIVAMVLITNKESTVVDGINLNINYNSSSILQFIVMTHFLAAIYSIITLFIIYRLGQKAPDPIHYSCLFVFDLMIALLLGAGLVAHGIFLQIAGFGETRVGWLGISDKFRDFCFRLNMMLMLSVYSFTFYICSAGLWVKEYRTSNRINPI